MFKNHWEKMLGATWRDELETSLDLRRAKGIHLVAEEKGKGEIHRFVSIGDHRPDNRSVVNKAIRDLAELKLRDQDPKKTIISAVKWINDTAG
jgi:hypothetical protein